MLRFSCLRGTKTLESRLRERLLNSSLVHNRRLHRRLYSFSCGVHTSITSCGLHGISACASMYIVGGSRFENRRLWPYCIYATGAAIHAVRSKQIAALHSLGTHIFLQWQLSARACVAWVTMSLLLERVSGPRRRRRRRRLCFLGVSDASHWGTIISDDSVTDCSAP